MFFIVPLRRAELTVERPLAKCETRARSCCMAKVSVYFVYLLSKAPSSAYRLKLSDTVYQGIKLDSQQTIKLILFKVLI